MENGKDGLKLAIKDMNAHIIMEISQEFIKNGTWQEKFLRILLTV